MTAGSGYSSILSFSGNNNRIDGYSYDASGNLLNDGTHQYSYDAESRIISVDNGATATYVYDPEGRRVQKTTASGAVYYLYDLAGHQSNELSSSGTLNRSEVYAGGHHLATYTGGTTYFDHADWLGTERARSGIAGTVCETIASLAFGDGQVTTGSCGDPSPLHFTGNQRDTESGLDDFDARYYSSTLGRFISADWSAVPEPVPYAHPSNPQTLNLYAIVSDNVESFADLDGHDYNVQGDLTFTAGDWGTLESVVHLECPGCEIEGPSTSLSGSITDPSNGVFATYTYYDPAQQAAAASQPQQNNRSGYDTQDQAAAAALRNSNGASITQNKEYAGLIYEDKDGKYHYTGPVGGTDQGSDPHDAKAPRGTHVVGDYHTHGDYSVRGPDGKSVRTHDPKRDDFNSNHFSPGDDQTTAHDARGKPGYLSYLGTPSGRFLTYNPRTGKEGPLQ